MKNFRRLRMPSVKFFKFLFLLLLALALTLPSFPADTLAASRSLSMEKVAIDAKLLPDASMQVTQKLTINFSGHWNGFAIQIPLDNMTIKEISVAENGKPYKFNPTTEYGPPGTFLVKKSGNTGIIDWSIDANDETRTFAVSYRAFNAVTVYNDTAELYYKFISEDNQQSIKDVYIHLRLPDGAQNYKQGEDIRIWGHGPLNGEVDFISPTEVVWKVTNLEPNTFVEARVVMPVALFPQAPAEAKSNKNALASILKEEQEWANEANRQRWIARADIGGGIGVVAAVLVITYLLWRRYGKAHPVQFDGEYYRELPGNYSPAELGYLWNFQDTEPRDLMATIMDLARRRFLRIDEEKTDKKGLLGTKEVKSYKLTFLDPPAAEVLSTQPAASPLREHEEELLNFLKEKIAKERDYLYLHEIENYATQRSTSFNSFWQKWTRLIKEEAEALGFFETSGSLSLITTIAGLALAIGGAVLLKLMLYLGVGMIIGGVILMFLPSRFKRRSPTGQEDYVRWQAFKRFLQHFSQMDRHEIPSLIIWEHYLVYAITLGVAQEVIKQLEIVFPNLEDETGHRFGHGWYYYGAAYPGFKLFNESFEAMERSLSSAVNIAQATAKKASSRSSSGSGGGGGFSSGGGGGRGGSSYSGR